MRGMESVWQIIMANVITCDISWNVKEMHMNDIICWKTSLPKQLFVSIWLKNGMLVLTSK